jgi:putative NADH-flavin reductase
MHIALFGATGGAGRQILAQALEQGHSLTALARDPSRLAPREGLTAIGGDVLNPAAVAECIQGADAVIYALGSHGRQEPIEARGTGHRSPGRFGYS